MSFKAKLTIDGEEYDVLHCSYQLTRDVDPKGRPSSHVHGGTISFEIESTESTFWFDWMIDQWAKKDGEVEFMDRAEETTMRKLEFKEAYIIGLSESFDSVGGRAMTASFTISAKSVGWGQGAHENDWPL